MTLGERAKRLLVGAAVGAAAGLLLSLAARFTGGT